MWGREIRWRRWSIGKIWSLSEATSEPFERIVEVPLTLARDRSVRCWCRRRRYLISKAIPVRIRRITIVAMATAEERRKKFNSSNKDPFKYQCRSPNPWASGRRNKNHLRRKGEARCSFQWHLQSCRTLRHARRSWIVWQGTYCSILHARSQRISSSGGQE